jgi:hypothetical protein
VWANPLLSWSKPYLELSNILTESVGSFMMDNGISLADDANAMDDKTIDSIRIRCGAWLIITHVRISMILLKMDLSNSGYNVLRDW